jgi:hypothetical protein
MLDSCDTFLDFLFHIVFDVKTEGILSHTSQNKNPWVDFRFEMDDTEALDRLIWGITGLRPTEAVGGGGIGSPFSSLSNNGKQPV